MSKWLCERQGYKQEDIVMLLDSRDATAMSVPTRANMVRALFSSRDPSLLIGIISFFF
jgi:hypothetical protein